MACIPHASLLLAPLSLCLSYTVSMLACCMRLGMTATHPLDRLLFASCSFISLSFPLVCVYVLEVPYCGHLLRHVVAVPDSTGYRRVSTLCSLARSLSSRIRRTQTKQNLCRLCMCVCVRWAAAEGALSCSFIEQNQWFYTSWGRHCEMKSLHATILHKAHTSPRDCLVGKEGFIAGGSFNIPLGLCAQVFWSFLYEGNCNFLSPPEAQGVSKKRIYDALNNEAYILDDEVFFPQ